MSHYTLDELIELWRREKLTAEQMIGQLLQTLHGQQQRLRELERRLPAAADAPIDSDRRR
jgi:hypothetical protein